MRHPLLISKTSIQDALLRSFHSVIAVSQWPCAGQFDSEEPSAWIV